MAPIKNLQITRSYKTIQLSYKEKENEMILIINQDQMSVKIIKDEYQCQAKVQIYQFAQLFHEFEVCNSDLDFVKDLLFI